MNTLYFVAFNFIIYAFLGWVIEELYCFFINRRFKKEGFLIGPLKPMYGIAMVTLVLCYYRFKIRGITMAILSLIIPSAVEYVSGYLMKNLFDEVYWSYKKVKFNVHGYICLKFSLYWMVLSLIGVLFFQPILNRIYNNMTVGYLKVGIGLITLLCILDFLLTLKERLPRLYIKA